MSDFLERPQREFVWPEHRRERRRLDQRHADDMIAAAGPPDPLESVRRRRANRARLDASATVETTPDPRPLARLWQRVSVPLRRRAHRLRTAMAQDSNRSVIHLVVVALGSAVLTVSIVWLAVSWSDDAQASGPADLIVASPPPTPAPAPTVVPSPTAMPSPTPTATPVPQIYVHVSGQVVDPGVVALPFDARAYDAVAAAGGAAPNADLDRVNLAALLADGRQLHVPAIGDDEASAVDLTRAESAAIVPTPPTQAPTATPLAALAADSAAADLTDGSPPPISIEVDGQTVPLDGTLPPWYDDDEPPWGSDEPAWPTDAEGAGADGG